MSKQHVKCEYDSLQRENSRLMGEMARHIKEKEMAVAEEDRLRKHSLKQQAMLQEMRRKLASKAHYQGDTLSLHYNFVLASTTCLRKNRLTDRNFIREL